jgi:hypothetical protein
MQSIPLCSEFPDEIIINENGFKIIGKEDEINVIFADILTISGIMFDNIKKRFEFDVIYKKDSVTIKVGFKEGVERIEELHQLITKGYIKAIRALDGGIVTNINT